MNFKIKIFIIILIAIFLPATTTATLIYVQAERALIQQTRQKVAATMENSINTFDEGLNAMVVNSSEIKKNQQMLSLIESLELASADEKRKIYSTIQQKLSDQFAKIQAHNISEELESIYIYLPDHNVVLTTDTLYYEDAGEKYISFVEQHTNKNQWFISEPIKFDATCKPDSCELLLSYADSIDNKYGEVIGVYSVNLKKEVFDRLRSEFSQELPCCMTVLDDNETMIFPCEAIDLEEEVKSELRKVPLFSSEQRSVPPVQINSDRHYVISVVSSGNKWKYHALIKDYDILEKMQDTRRSLLVIISINGATGVLLSLLITSKVCGSLNTLVAACGGRENDLSMKIKKKCKDEYRKTFDECSIMQRELDRLRDDLKKAKILTKEAEIKLLQEQINPHFLYNALDSVYSMAMIHDIPEIAQMVYAMSQFYRIGLSGGRDIVTLREAVKIAESYIKVQNIRFKDKFGLTLDIPEDLMNCNTLKFILQPFVENAIYHGLKHKEKGELRIAAQKQENFLVLYIEDNGIGISPEKISQIKDSLLEDYNPDEENFAIRNLNEQIRLRYGSEYGIVLSSEESKGTQITIKLPYIVAFQ